MRESTLIEAMAMMAENMQRIAVGESPAYSEKAFLDLTARLDRAEGLDAPDHTCDVCSKRTPNVLILCDDCDPTVDGKVAGKGAGVERLQVELDAARAEIERLKANVTVKTCCLCGKGDATFEIIKGNLYMMCQACAVKDQLNGGMGWR